MFGNLGKMTEALSKMGDMKKQMEEMQKRISSIKVIGSAGGGMVTVTVTGDNRVVDVKIAKELTQGEEIKMLEDLVIAATNDALNKVKDSMAHEMKNMTGGMDMGALSKMFGSNLGG